MDNEDLLNLLTEPWTFLAKQTEKQNYDLIVGLSSSIQDLKPLVKNLDFKALAKLINQLSFLLVFCESRGVYQATRKLVNLQKAEEAYLEAMRDGLAAVEKEINSMNGDLH